MENIKYIKMVEESEKIRIIIDLTVYLKMVVKSFTIV